MKASILEKTWGEEENTTENSGQKPNCSDVFLMLHLANDIHALWNNLLKMNATLNIVSLCC